MDNVFQIERGTNNILIVGVTHDTQVYEAKSALDCLVPYYFKQVIVIPGLEGAYLIKK